MDKQEIVSILRERDILNFENLYLAMQTAYDKGYQKGYVDGSTTKETCEKEND